MDHKLCKQCKGYCCDDIGLTVSPEELENKYHGRYSMFVFTHKDNVHPDGNIVDYKKTVYHYRCSEHDTETGKCNVYDGRPLLCKTYPDNGFCGYKDVDIDEVINARPGWFSFGMTHLQADKHLFQNKT